MLEKCLEAGFNKEMVLSTINSMLFLKGNEETFVTLDISAIDLFNGKLQTIKTGAAPTFIKEKWSKNDKFSVFTCRNAEGRRLSSLRGIS